MTTRKKRIRALLGHYNETYKCADFVLPGGPRGEELYIIRKSDVPALIEQIAVDCNGSRSLRPALTWALKRAGISAKGRAK